MLQTIFIARRLSIVKRAKVSLKIGICILRYAQCTKLESLDGKEIAD